MAEQAEEGDQVQQVVVGAREHEIEGPKRRQETLKPLLQLLKEEEGTQKRADDRL